MLRVEPYAARHADVWNAFLRDGKNAHFLFDRRYMDYHRDRFRDASLMVFRDEELIALLPGNVADGAYVSHQGLTFGGFVTQDGAMTTPLMLRIMEEAIEHLRKQGLTRLVYKALPHIYHRKPAEEDLYALARMGAQPARVGVTTTIRLEERGKVSQRRLRGARKAAKAGIVTARSERWEAFWALLADRLRQRHGVEPVHSLDEIRLLAARLPEHISLHTAELEGQVAAGVVIYETATVAHAQYIAASDLGLETGALDGLFEHLIGVYADSKRYFDFGISTEGQAEDRGPVLNEGLIAQKEGFGGSAVVHVQYALDL